MPCLSPINLSFVSGEEQKSALFKSTENDKCVELLLKDSLHLKSEFRRIFQVSVSQIPLFSDKRHMHQKRIYK